MITGRTFRLWGAIGVIIKFCEPGTAIGPPQLSEYAVEPVGVEIIRPSAQYAFRNSPLIQALIVIMLEESFLTTVTSFNPNGTSSNKGLLLLSIRSRLRLSRRNFFSASN